MILLIEKEEIYKEILFSGETKIIVFKENRSKSEKGVICVKGADVFSKG
jgi:hypothetical protein